eukprot:TRINITY_DN2596_c0_g1_i3.p1 TRINITY_DN2596_c0_g1~~TRINITY_DN2596_c0_g1_i3.p1  ORF type:complete len:128 (-),score=32.25 TRINITY_DN2596_c0_g1_i3:50-376(-)
MSTTKDISPIINIPAREDGWKPNPRDLSTTPGGTMFAFTPGGTRIVYDRNTLLKLANSPLAKTPPTHLPKIPGVTAPSSYAKDDSSDDEKDTEKSNNGGDEDLFNMDN